MDALYIILLLLIIIILVTGQSSLNRKIEALEFKIIDLQSLIRKLNSIKPSAENAKTLVNEEPVREPVKDIVQQAAAPAPKLEKEVVEYHKEVISDAKSSIIHSTIKTSRTFQKEEPRLSFFERYPDLEKFIGENLVNKIGIAILVLAIGFFVKYAIDNNWVGPAGRVGIGILCGGILIAIAHRLRNNYKAFSSVLVGGGLAIFYFTITLAYHEFHLFDQTTSFIILIVITVFAVVLSLLYDKQELAVTALVGGMASPFMVSNGSANYNALFIYLLVLNTGLLVLAYRKAWRILNISAFGLTVLVLGGIIYTLPTGADSVSFLYISILYLLFFLINIANNIKENKKFITSDFSILLINTALYFSTGLYLLTMMHDQLYRGLFSAALGALNLLFSFILYRTKKAEINILYLLIGITLTFISLTAPIQLHGHFITLFWAAEGVVLYWLYQKSGIKLMRLTSLIIWIAMLLSLMMDWGSIYGLNNVKLTIIANKGFITTLCAAMSSFLLYVLSKKPDENQPLIPSRVFLYAGIILLFSSGGLEINQQFLSRYPGTDLNVLYLMLYLPVFVYLLNMLTGKISGLSFEVSGGINAAAIIVYLLMIPKYFDLQATMLTGHKIDAVHFAAHWISDVFMLLIFYRLIMICKDSLQAYIGPVSWAIVTAVLIFFSFEVCLLSNFVFYSRATSLDNLQTIYIKTGLPVLWGMISFALMWLGMRYKTRVLRVISLVLFTLTLIKLFVFDIEDIAPAGKIAAFFCLGVLLLIISFMYQKVKVIIADDEPSKK